MACNLELHAITIYVVLACNNHTCGVFFNDKPAIAGFEWTGPAFQSQINLAAILLLIICCFMLLTSMGKGRSAAFVGSSVLVLQFIILWAGQYECPCCDVFL